MESSRPPSSISSARQERCRDYRYTMEQFIALCDIFGKMDRTSAGVVHRADFLSALRELGTDIEFQKLVRRTGLANRFHDTAKELTLDEFVALILPRAMAAERIQACRWADLWKVRRTFEIGGFEGDPAELRCLFTMLDGACVGSVQLKELVRAQLFSHEELSNMLPRHRGLKPLSCEEFCEFVGPALCHKYRCSEHDFSLSSIKGQSSKRTAFHSILTMRKTSFPETSVVEITAASKAGTGGPLRPQGLPRLPSSSRQASPFSRSNNSGARSASSSLDGQTLTGDALADASCADMTRSEPPKRFEASRTQRAKAVCNGGTDDACLRNYEFLKKCSYLFVTFLLDELLCEMFKPGDIIMKEGDVGDKIYFLRRGEADVLIGPDLRKIAELKEGVAFGEMALFESAGKRTATVRATELSDCRTLNKMTFMKLLDHFPEDKELFRKLARQRSGLQKTAPTRSRSYRGHSDKRPGRSPGVESRDAASMITSITPVVSAF